MKLTLTLTDDNDDIFSTIEHEINSETYMAIEVLLEFQKKNPTLLTESLIRKLAYETRKPYFQKRYENLKG